MATDPTYCQFCRRKFKRLDIRLRHQQRSCKIANTEAGRQALFEQVHRDEILVLSKRADTSEKEIAVLKAALSSSIQSRSAASGDGAVVVATDRSAAAALGGTAIVYNIQVINIVDRVPRGLRGNMCLRPFGEETPPSREDLIGQVEGLLCDGYTRQTLGDRNIQACHDMYQPASLTTGLGLTNSIYGCIFAVPGNANAYVSPGRGSRFVVYIGKGSGWATMDTRNFVDGVSSIVDRTIDLIGDDDILGPGGGQITGKIFKNGWRSLDRMGRSDDECVGTLTLKMVRMLRMYRKIFNRMGVQILKNDDVAHLGGLEAIKKLRPRDGISIIVDVDPCEPHICESRICPQSRGPPVDAAEDAPARYEAVAEDAAEAVAEDAA